MNSPGETTVLEIVKKDPKLLAQVLDGVNHPWSSYLCKLILNSHDVVARRSAPWTFKSLMEYGEEDFCKGGSFRVSYDRDGTRRTNAWLSDAAKALGQDVCRNLIYEEEEGLILFVLDRGSFRPARRGDNCYEFVKRLQVDADLFEHAIDKPTSWALELFLSKVNVDAYACMWYDLDYLSMPGREEQKAARREAVWRQTLRGLRCEPYTATVPAPEEWDLTVSTSNAVRGEVAARTVTAEARTSISDKERDNLLRLIGALLELVQSPRAGRDSDAAVIRELVDNYGDKPGMSKSNLDRKIPEAKRSLRDG
jgi:hypothetical protein